MGDNDLHGNAATTLEQLIPETVTESATSSTESKDASTPTKTVHSMADGTSPSEDQATDAIDNLDPPTTSPESVLLPIFHSHPPASTWSHHSIHTTPKDSPLFTEDIVLGVDEAGRGPVLGEQAIN
jgi:hypothetical protein